MKVALSFYENIFHFGQKISSSWVGRSISTIGKLPVIQSLWSKVLPASWTYTKAFVVNRPITVGSACAVAIIAIAARRFAATDKVAKEDVPKASPPVEDAEDVEDSMENKALELGYFSQLWEALGGVRALMELPELNGVQGGDYLKLSPKQLSSSVMRGVDSADRPFIAIRIQDPSSDPKYLNKVRVEVFHRRYSLCEEDDRWVLSASHNQSLRQNCHLPGEEKNKEDFNRLTRLIAGESVERLTTWFGKDTSGKVSLA